MADPLFYAGDEVLICFEVRVLGKILHQCAGLCSEHGDFMYRIDYESPGGFESQGVFCEFVLAMRVAQ